MKVNSLFVYRAGGKYFKDDIIIYILQLKIIYRL